MNFRIKKNLSFGKNLKFLKRKLQRYLVFKLIYKNLYFYELAIFLARFTNFLLPHEEDIFGLNYLKFDKNMDIIDVGASDGLYFKSINPDESGIVGLYGVIIYGLILVFSFIISRYYIL